MKNQYFGDIGDYGKYGFLRFWASFGIKIGVNWYLTEDDGSSDGKHISYLNDTKDRIYDPTLYDGLKDMFRLHGRCVKNIQDSDLIPNAVYYDDILNTNRLSPELRENERKRWHSKAMDVLAKSRLVFMDPDNGSLGKKRISRKDSQKFVAQSEIADFYDSGKNVVYYCHKGRRTDAMWEEKKREMLKLLPDATIIVLTFHRGTQRSFVFVVHNEDYKIYNEIVSRFLNTPWGELFTLDGEYHG